MSIEFFDQPCRTHDMEYSGDARQDKCLRGRHNDTPIVKLTDRFCRSGVLYVVSVCHLATTKNQYHLHPNLLCSDRKKDKHCNDAGVANYKFDNKSGEINIRLENLCIRHSTKKSFNELKKKMSTSKEKFDPFEIGYSDAKELNLEYIRLCCCAVFKDNQKSNILVSDEIYNGPSDLKLEYWDDNRQVVADSTNEYIYCLMRKISLEQREIYAKFYDNKNWIVEVEPVKCHHDYAFVFKIPPYEDSLIQESIICNFQLKVRNKEYYFSEAKTFLYIPNQIRIDLDPINICIDDWINTNDVENNPGIKRSINEVFTNDVNFVENTQSCKKPRFAATDSFFKKPETILTNIDNSSYTIELENNSQESSVFTVDDYVDICNELIENPGQFINSDFKA